MRDDDDRAFDDDRRDAVAAFGRAVVETGREYTLDTLYLALDGRMGYPGAREMEAGFRALSTDQQAYVRELVKEVVENAVHNTLWAIERLPWVALIATNEETGARTDITAESDGLTLALHGEDGWFATYSRHPRSAFSEDW